MAKYSYYAVILNHETGKMFIDDSFVEEYTGGNIYDEEEGDWVNFKDKNDIDGRMDLGGLLVLTELVENIIEVTPETINAFKKKENI